MASESDKELFGEHPCVQGKGLRQPRTTAVTEHRDSASVWIKNTMAISHHLSQALN